MTLESQYGDILSLKEKDDYVVFHSEGETQIAVTYQHWSYTPVYTTLTIQAERAGVYTMHRFDIASVYTYMVQQGGGGYTVDGTVTAYSYYGYDNLTSWEQVFSPASYTLFVTQEETTSYYAEDENGNAYLTLDEEAAKSFDGSGEEDMNMQLINNTVYVTSRVDATELKTVDGISMTFTKQYSGASSLRADPSAARGYYSDGSSHAMWAWQSAIELGWMHENGITTASPYATNPTDSMSADELLLYARELSSDGDMEGAYYYLKMAADMGYDKAQWLLGESYMKGTYGITDFKLAVEYLTLAGEGGTPRAYTDLGIIYLEGYLGAPDYQLALEAFEKGSDADDAKAPRYLGYMYEMALGVEQDFSKAAYYYQLAADRNDITAKYYLAKLYLDGAGVKQDNDRAFALLTEITAERQDQVTAEAMALLSYLYENGIGTEIDLDAAEKWYQLALDAGYEP